MHNISTGSSFEAELWGIVTGINITREAGTHRLEVETDCVEVVSFINNLCPLHHPSHALIRAIQNLLSKLDCYRISHVFLEMNRCADFLANKAVTLPIGITPFLDPPEDLLHLLKDDYHGVALPRIVAT
ncbi:hypothetical protein M5689_021043 [Euphorbia peplus]|nr:hypothetical protein M5689_021043 [Euphorbia peplus]